MKGFMNKIVAGVITVGVSLGMITSNAYANAGLLGDVNGDGYISAIDASILTQYLRGNCEITYNGAADADRDLVLTPADVDMINKHVAGAMTLPTIQNELTVPDMDTYRNYTLYDCENDTTSTYTLTANVQWLSLEDEPMPAADGIDDRETSDDTAVVRINVPGGYGSGFIIDNNIIATAAHCVYSKNNSAFIDFDISIMNSDCSGDPHNVEPKEVHVCNQYITETNTNIYFKYDYALIYVEEDLSSYGKFDFGIPSDEFMTSDSEVYASGFNGNNRLYAVGNIMDIRPYDEQVVTNTVIVNHQIQYSTYTAGGQSGGPVYIKRTYNGQEQNIAVGIHSSGSTTTHYGTRMTASLLRFYKNNDYIGSTVS